MSKTNTYQSPSAALISGSLHFACLGQDSYCNHWLWREGIPRNSPSQIWSARNYNAFLQMFTGRAISTPNLSKVIKQINKTESTRTFLILIWDNCNAVYVTDISFKTNWQNFESLFLNPFSQLTFLLKYITI